MRLEIVVLTNMRINKIYHVTTEKVNDYEIFELLNISMLFYINETIVKRSEQ